MNGEKRNVKKGKKLGKNGEKWGKMGNKWGTNGENMDLSICIFLHVFCFFDFFCFFWGGVFFQAKKNTDKRKKKQQIAEKQIENANINANAWTNPFFPIFVFPF